MSIEKGPITPPRGTFHNPYQLDEARLLATFREGNEHELSDRGVLGVVIDTLIDRGKIPLLEPRFDVNSRPDTTGRVVQIDGGLRDYDGSTRYGITVEAENKHKQRVIWDDVPVITVFPDGEWDAPGDGFDESHCEVVIHLAEILKRCRKPQAVYSVHSTIYKPKIERIDAAVLPNLNADLRTLSVPV